MATSNPHPLPAARPSVALRLLFECLLQTGQLRYCEEEPFIFPKLSSISDKLRDYLHVSRGQPLWEASYLAQHLGW